MNHRFSAKARLQYFKADKGSWFYVALSKKLSAEVRDLCVKSKGWARVPVQVTIGKTTWKTNLFSNKEGQYLFVIKKSVREAEGLKEGDMLSVAISTC